MRLPSLLSLRIPVLLLTLSLLLWPGAGAQSQDTASVSDAIRQLLEHQAADWNRGDIPAFMQGYKDAPDTTFVGRTVAHGHRMILERYQRQFPSKAAMGTLSFSDLDIRPLDPHYAVATGHFHLDRTAAAGGPALGVFSLVFENTGQGWKIILDHSS